MLTETKPDAETEAEVEAGWVRRAGRRGEIGAARTLAGLSVLAAALAVLLVAPIQVRHGADPQRRAEALTGRTQAVVAASQANQVVPANLTPALGKVHADFPAPWDDGCLLQWTPIEQPPCVAGDPTSPTTVVLFGDSHAAQWFPAMDQIARRRHWRLRTLAKVTCPPLDLPIHLPYLHREYTECELWRRTAVTALRAQRPHLVVLDMRRFYDRPSWWVQSYDQRWLRALSRMVGTLQSAGSAVLVLGPLPEPGGDVPSCVSAHPTSLAACNAPRARALDPVGIAAERAATEAGGGHYLDLTPLFCGPTHCPVVVADKLVYVDNDHLTTTYVRWLAPVLAAALDATMS